MTPTLCSSMPSPVQSTIEHRSAFRRRKVTPVVVADNKDGKNPFRAWVLDRSLGGFRLSVGRKYPVNKVLRIRPADAPEGVPWVQLKVKNAVAREYQWELGCQVVGSPAYSVLLRFG